MKVLIKKGNVEEFSRITLIFLVGKEGEAWRQSDVESQSVRVKNKGFGAQVVEKVLFSGNV